MALTELQRIVCRLIAANRIASGESYVAGGLALGELIASPRLSRDIDLFHDTEEALAVTWAADRSLLEREGYSVVVSRERPAFVEVLVRSASGETVLMQWARESSFRFFPLVEHEVLGLTMHPFDLATNKVLALVGRLEVRDWIDVIACDERIQPLGYLAWAACGKDPGFAPSTIIEHASRSGHYSEPEVAALDFEGPVPSAAALGARWHSILESARAVVDALPADRVGTCVLDSECRLLTADAGALRKARGLRFHEGSIRGAFPSLRS